MPKPKKMTKEQRKYILAKIDNEGFDYFFCHYSSCEDIKDERFHELRKAYLKATKDLQDYIGMEEF